LQFFGIGPLELLMILVVALIELQPQRLPEAAIYIARAIKAVRRYAATITAEFRREFREAYEEIEQMRMELQELRQALREHAAQVERELQEAAHKAESSLSAQEPGDNPSLADPRPPQGPSP